MNELKEILELTNKINTNPVSRAETIAALSTELGALALWPKAALEQMLEAERVFWTKTITPEIMKGADKIIGEERAKEGDQNRQRSTRFVELFIEKIQPAILEAYHEAGFI